MAKLFRKRGGRKKEASYSSTSRENGAVSLNESSNVLVGASVRLDVTYIPSGNADNVTCASKNFLDSRSMPAALAEIAESSIQRHSKKYNLKQLRLVDVDAYGTTVEKLCFISKLFQT